MLAAACSPAPSVEAGSDPEALSARLTAYLDAEYEEELALDPEELTAQGRKEAYDRLTDRSEAAMDALLAWRRESVAEMKTMFDYAALTPEAQTSYDVWEAELARAEEQAKFRRHRYLFARGGAHTGLPNFMINFHRVDDVSDMEAYIARVALIDDAIDQLLARAKAAAQDGVRQPRFAYDQALSEVRRVVSGAPFSPGDPSALFADANVKIAALVEAGKATPADAERLAAAVSEAMTGQMKPAYDRLASWLESDRSAAPMPATGALALPDGAAYYASALGLMTTTQMSADEIHDLGLSEVSRIRAEMDAIRERVGFSGDLAAFFQHLRSDAQFYFPDTEEGRRAYISLAEAYLGEMAKKLPDYFGILPRAGLVVKRVEPFREEAGGAQHYMSGTADGSRPGVFYAHLSDMRAMPKYQLENISYHEGNPGHHMQISIAQELTGLPRFRTQYGYTAFSEGWGLYSEALGKEMGFYQDPYSDFGRLAGEMWRAIRLVVDTGLHAKGWSEEEAVAYFLANSPQPEAAVRSEIRRYIVTPGQATAYKVGMIRLQELRDEAKKELGDGFDYRGFHDVVLGGGSLPLPILEKRVRRWIAETKAGR
jgi:uncharacterized protein (DUF885 family)